MTGLPISGNPLPPCAPIAKWIAPCLAAMLLPIGAMEAQDVSGTDVGHAQYCENAGVTELSEPGIVYSCWRAIRRLVLPDILALIYDLRDFITELPPPEPRTLTGDLSRLDAIYERAVYLSDGNPYHALLGLAWATLPYHRFPAMLPLVGWGITVPVSTETESDFKQRLANLPGVLLPNSPPSLDRDKLPHFFGSAWMQCVLNAPDLADMLGDMFELMEEVFKLEGSRDDRDIQVNRLGIIFAMQLQRHRAVRPSDVFLLEMNDNDHANHPHR